MFFSFKGAYCARPECVGSEHVPPGFATWPALSKRCTGDRGPIGVDGLADPGRRLTQPDVRSVVCVHRVPPQSFLEWHRVVGWFHDSDRDEPGQPLGETFLDEGHPAGARDHQRHQLKAVHGDLHARFDAEQADLASGGRVVGALVRHPR